MIFCSAREYTFLPQDDAFSGSTDTLDQRSDDGEK